MKASATLLVTSFAALVLFIIASPSEPTPKILPLGGPFRPGVTCGSCGPDLKGTCAEGFTTCDADSRRSLRRTCCDTFGTTWGPGIGPPPSGCSGQACQAGAGTSDGGTGQPSAAVTTTPATANLLGDVALTTVQGTCSSCQFATNGVFPVGENIYGPYEAGFGAQQDFILEGLGCNPGSDGRLDGGIDTETAEAMVAYQCNINLPRYDSGSYVSLLDECGGHTKEYHFHERLSCLYTNETGSPHSAKIGQGSDGKGFYGKWEDWTNSLLPKLDVCGGHFGVTPESNNKKVYHYHVQEKAPFTIGCYGPDYASDGSEMLVSLAKCRQMYSSVTAQDGSQACGAGTQSVTTKSGTYTYDNWCPCYDANGSNMGNVELAVWDNAADTICNTSDCASSSSTPASTPPASTPTPAPVASYTIVGTLSLAGVTATSLSTADKTSLKEVIATKVGSVCGANGGSACTSSDVTVTVTRRDAIVSYTVAVYSASAASSGSVNIQAVSNSAMTNAITAKGGGLSSASVTANTASAATASAASALQASHGFTVLAVFAATLN